MRSLFLSTALGMLFPLSLVAQDKSPEVSSNARLAVAMATAASRFYETLDADAKGRVMLAYQDPARRDWHNIPKPSRKGMQLRDMTDAQKQACMALVETGLSPTGFQKAKQVMRLEANLRDGEKDLVNGAIRDPERYFVTLFGQPSQQGAWGWSFEGHHLSLNFAIVEGVIVGDTPTFMGANPAIVQRFVEGGPELGSRALAEEEQLAFELVKSLDPTQLAKAIIAKEAPNEYHEPGRPEPPQLPLEGLAAAQMTDAQKGMLRKLLQCYCQNFPQPLADQRLREMDRADFDQIHFAWAGPIEPGIGHYYRLSGPVLLLEFVNVQKDPAGNPANHIHTVWRHLTHDFGIPSTR